MTREPPQCDIETLEKLEAYAPHWLTPADRYALRQHRAAPLVRRVTLWGPLAVVAALAFLPFAFAWFTPCATEDSSNCYWDAAERGNGTGTSFLDIGGAIVWQGAVK